MEKFKDSPLEANLISAYMKSASEGLFSTHTVGELLWGYEDALLKALKVLRPELDDVFGLFYKVYLTTSDILYFVLAVLVFGIFRRKAAYRICFITEQCFK